MSFGLQTFNSSGVETLNTNYQISRIHSVISGISVTANSSKFISVAGIVNDGTWHVFLNNSSSNAYIQINNNGFTISVPQFSQNLSGAVCIVLRSNGDETATGFGLFGKNDINQVQIDQNFSNYVFVGGANNVAVNVNQTLPSGYNFQNSLVFARPSGSGYVSLFQITSSNTFNFGQGNNYDWVCYAPASSQPVPSSGYGMSVYNQSGQLVFDTNYRYLKYAGKIDISLDSFDYLFNSSTQSNEKNYVLLTNFGLLRIVWTGFEHAWIYAGMYSTDGINIGVNDYFILRPVPTEPTSLTFGTVRQYTFFQSKLS